jgi:hypothetical protein
MPDISLSFANYQRQWFPQAVALNCLAERAPSKPTAPQALFARPGLVDFAEPATAPFRGVFQRDGLLGDASFMVMNNAAVLLDADGVETAITGTIAGDDEVEIDGGLDADFNSIVRVANGSALYKYDSSTGAIVQEDFPDVGGAGATSVGFWKGYWVATEAGTDAVFYLKPGETAWNPIMYAAAEYGPDRTVGLRILGELAWLMGTATTEPWRLTGDGSDPMGPAGGLAFDYGCRNIAAARNCGGQALIWVDNNCAVQLTQGGEPVIISGEGEAEQIRRCPAADLSATYFVKDQHPVYVLHLGTMATLVYDLAAKRWFRFSSLGYDYWRVRFVATIGDKALACDRISNTVWTLDPDALSDGDDVFPVEFCGFLPVSEGQVDVGNVELDCLTGEAPRMGQGSDPQIGLRISRDDGRTWSDVRYRPLGAAGETISPRWNGLGMATAPRGLLLKWECSEPVGRRFSAARVNVP